MAEKRPSPVADSYAIKLEWRDQARNASDPDAPFYFGPYPSRDSAEGAIDFVNRYQDADNEPDEQRVVGEVVSYGPHAHQCQSPALLRMFMAL
jgi:hypothetical protein